MAKHEERKSVFKGLLSNVKSELAIVRWKAGSFAELAREWVTMHSTCGWGSWKYYLSLTDYNRFRLGKRETMINGNRKTGMSADFRDWLTCVWLSTKFLAAPFNCKTFEYIKLEISLTSVLCYHFHEHRKM